MNINELQTYEEIVRHLRHKRRIKHLLMGNGFSMAYDPSIFSYNALSTFIENSDDELLKQLFRAINTKNFEIIMQELDNFAKIAKIFTTDKTLVDRIIQASEKLQDSLIGAVQQLHPEHVFTVPEEKSALCFKFL